MLGFNAGPVELADPYTRTEVAMDFAFCYLASYAHQEIPTRVLTAFGNSYSLANVWRWPRINNVRPNMLAVRQIYPWGSHIIIAIEGTTTTTQIALQTVGSAAAEAIDTPAGRVPQFYKVAATAMAQLIAQTPDLVAVMGNPTTQITFTGFSMGAAIAEIMAATTAALAPTRTIRLRTFGKTRVGNYEWHNNRPRTLNNVCVYNRGDRMHCLPNDGVRMHTFGPVLILGVPTYFQPDPAAAVWNGDDLAIASIPATNGIDQTNWIAGYLAPMNTLNVCYPHLMNSYRHMFCKTFRNDRGVDGLRFRYLEFPDDNKWQTAWEATPTWSRDWLGVLDPAPADIEEPAQVVNEMRLHNAQPPDQGPNARPLIADVNMFRGSVVPAEISNGRRRNRHAPQLGN